MELSQEQKERIKQNRERALEIQRQRQKLCTTAAVKDKTPTSATKRSFESNDEKSNGSNTKRVKEEPSTERDQDGSKRNEDAVANGTKVGNDDDEYHTDEIELFEENASEYVTKQEAMKVYCLPMGTLDVCRNCITKPNPKHATWSNMKLYLRKEIRYRAHLRYGGMVGLIQERKQRNQNRLQKDMEQSKDIFK